MLILNFSHKENVAYLFPSETAALVEFDLNETFAVHFLSFSQGTLRLGFDLTKQMQIQRESVVLRESFCNVSTLAKVLVDELIKTRRINTCILRLLLRCHFEPSGIRFTEETFLVCLSVLLDSAINPLLKGTPIKPLVFSTASKQAPNNDTIENFLAACNTVASFFTFVKLRGKL